MSWSTSELRVRLAPLNRFKPSSKIFYWPLQGGTSFVDLLCFCSVLCLLCFVRVCLYVLCGHLLGKGWPLGSRLWCLLWVCHFPIGILGQVWYLIVSIPDLCTITYFYNLCKRFWPRSEPTLRRAWSGSKLFETLRAFLEALLEENVINLSKRHKKHAKRPSTQRVKEDHIWKDKITCPSLKCSQFCWC